jgi:hypothetical protein
MSFGESITLNDGVADNIYVDAASKNPLEGIYRDSVVASKYNHSLKIRQSIDDTKPEQVNRSNVVLNRTELNTDESVSYRGGLSFTITKDPLFSEAAILEMTEELQSFLTAANVGKLMRGEL